MNARTLLSLAVASALFGPQALGAEDNLERITVTGRAQSLYRVDDGSLATKTDTPLARTPQSVQILPLSLIEDQAALEVTDLYRSVSGVSQYNYASVTFRGFRQNEVRYDGVRGDPYADVSTPQLFNIEQVQVLKGPSGALYGAGDPGGLINYVTKKPGYQHDNRLKFTAGNQDFVSGSLELSGPLTEAADQRYRLGLYQDHENPYRWNTDNRRRVLDGGYALDLGQDSTLTLQLTDVTQHQGGARLRGIPADAEGNFLADARWNANEASDFLSLDATVYQARLDHDLSDWLSSNLTVRYFDNTERQQYHEPASADDSDGDGLVDYAERQYRDQTRDNSAGSLTGNLVAELGSHTLLLGGDLARQDEDFYYQRARTADGVVGISYSDPQYGVTDPASYRMRLVTDSKARSLRYGVYVQDQWRLTDAWDLVGSVRLDGFEDKLKDNIGGGEESFHDRGWSYRLGSTYQLSEQLHPYVNLATGYSPQDLSSQQQSKGGPFDPELSKQWEAGLRSDWLNGAINLNLAAYHIERKNILQTDPSDSDRLIALGKVRSKGFEVDLLGDIASNWVLNANYAYNDAVVKEASSGISRSVGKRFANAPRHQFGLWTRYDITAIDSAIALGADYVSEQFDQDGNRIKAYTVFDASWQTHWQAWQFQLNVKNLFDKAYAVSGLLGRTGQFPGERRRLYLSASYRF